MNDSKPILRQVFAKVERAVGEPLEQLVGSKRYTDLILTLTQVQKALSGAIGGAVSEAAERALHLAQIPTRNDIRKLNRHLVEIATEVRALAAKQHGARPVGAVRKAKRAAPQTTTPTRTPAKTGVMPQAKATTRQVVRPTMRTSATTRSGQRVKNGTRVRNGK